jgi:hypothetical protein
MFILGWFEYETIANTLLFYIGVILKLIVLMPKNFYFHVCLRTNCL